MKTLNMKTPWTTALVVEKEYKVYSQTNLKKEFKKLLLSNVVIKEEATYKYMQKNYQELYLNGLVKGHLEDPANLPYYMLLKEVSTKNKEKNGHFSDNQPIKTLYSDKKVISWIMLKRKSPLHLNKLIRHNTVDGIIEGYLTFYYYLKKRYKLKKNIRVLVGTPYQLHLYLNLCLKYYLPYEIVGIMKKRIKSNKRRLIFCTYNSIKTIHSKDNPVATNYARRKHSDTIDDIDSTLLERHNKNFSTLYSLYRRYNSFNLVLTNYLTQYSKIMQFLTIYSNKNVLLQSMYYLCIKNQFQEEVFSIDTNNIAGLERNTEGIVFSEYMLKHHFYTKQRMRIKDIFGKQLFCVYYINKIQNNQISFISSLIRLVAITLISSVMSSLDVQKSAIINYRIHKNEYVGYISKQRYYFYYLLSKYLHYIYYFTM